MFSFPGNKKNQIETSKKCLEQGVLSVALPVIYQSRLRVERLPAVRAEMVFLSGMNSLVDLQLLGNGKPFFTKITVIGFFS